MDTFDSTEMETLAAALPEAIITRYAAYLQELADLTALDGITCTGAPHWRDNTKSTATAKLYINHSIDAACPVHGKPKPGSRLRSYIGTDPSKQRVAHEAIEREQERQTTAQRVKIMEAALYQAARELRSALSLLGYTTPEDTDTPRPDAEWPRIRRGW